jgi:hypothetical protein
MQMLQMKIFTLEVSKLAETEAHSGIQIMTTLMMIEFSSSLPSSLILEIMFLPSCKTAQRSLSLDS